MKIRQGFVSNSSSSSFIIGPPTPYDERAKSRAELLEQTYQEGWNAKDEDLSIPYVCNTDELWDLHGIPDTLAKEYEQKAGLSPGSLKRVFHRGVEDRTEKSIEETKHYD